MTEFLGVMAAPLAACVLLVLIHAMLGQHVLARGVVFVDLAMAQIAGLGGAVAFRLGAEPHSRAAYAWSFGFTLLGAALFSFLWDRGRPVLQEAFIGIAFSLAGAAAVLLLTNTAHGVDHLQSMLGGGGLLWLSWRDVGVMALLYGLVGALLVWKRETFELCSAHPASAARRGMSLRAWDFAFYAAFGLVVTSSVKAAGILAVFAFLIVPSVCAALLGFRGRAQLGWAWALGIAGSSAAVLASYAWDLPTGSAVVAVFGALALLLTLMPRRFRAKA